MKKLAILFFMVSAFLYAQEKPADEIAAAAANATNPLAFVTKLQVQPNYIIKDNEATQINVTTRIMQPTATLGLPFIKSKDPSKIYTIYRLEVPIIGQTFPNSPQLDATGLSDIVLLDIVAFKQAWGLLGVGTGLIMPTASSDFLGTGKWSSGISGVVLNTKTKGLQYGVLFQQYWSFAGDPDRQDKNFMLFQPIFNKLIAKGLVVQFSPIMNFDWENSDFTIPLSLGLTKVFAKNLSMTFTPEYVVSGPTKGDFTIRFQINAMFPPSK
nr:hypothetical protein [uncultured Flavobacterium sp.]